MVGSEKYPQDLVWDTGSAWLVLEVSDCLTCLNATFDPSTSTDYRRLTTGLSQLAYGSAQIIGYTSEDRFFVDNTIGLTKFPYFEIIAQ